MEKQEIIRRVSDGFDTAKAGSASAVYAEVAGYHDAGELPEKSHYAFGWIIYYALHQSKHAEIMERKKMLARYMKLAVPRPHKLHSMILTEAIRLYSEIREEEGFNRKESDGFSILRFLDLWGLDNLRPGDWGRKMHEGRRLNSTVEKLIRVVADEIEEKGIEPSPQILALIERALAEYPDSDTMLSRRGRLYQQAGEREKAAELFTKALLLAPGRSGNWVRLAGCLPEDKPVRVRIAMLYKALKTLKQDEFRGRIRIMLAEAMLSAGASAQALWELESVRLFYDRKGWHLPAAYQAVRRNIPDGTMPEDPEPSYKRVAHLADEEIYSALPEIAVRKTYHKDDANGAMGSKGQRKVVAWRVTDSENNNYWIQPHRYGITRNVEIGGMLTIRVLNGRAVSARIPEPAKE